MELIIIHFLSVSVSVSIYLFSLAIPFWNKPFQREIIKWAIERLKQQFNGTASKSKSFRNSYFEFINLFDELFMDIFPMGQIFIKYYKNSVVFDFDTKLLPYDLILVCSSIFSQFSFLFDCLKEKFSGCAHLIWKLHNA